MLTAKVCVRYEGDWTAKLAAHDVFGEFIASTFRDRRYVGIMAVECNADEVDTVLDVIGSHRFIDELEVVEEFEADGRDRISMTLFLEGGLTEFTPLQTLLYEGFLPIGPTKLENGRECFDLLLHDRDELSKAIELLEEFGNVTLDRISEEFRREVVPSRAGWQALLASIPPRRREVLNLALEEGYFEIPRQVTLEELADEMGITKTTASTHLRKAERQLVEFLLPYINLAAEEGEP
ncbi:helix-turn-helix domain-containing protein [Halobaculum magnesiiphilum]|uniref:Helix-turn-helix domain-containing protein n=1 Tax=Halobaculum magnesiiphilum TaxID=1017351 RepID=A0A8T8WI64_9EURY|nr:helix-turn-helix domain-containing protein [Halobaculum magnesiiphilum]QZP39572.1 helix-turn-helix domain-containing protein [Halobaculum magnesiiphilum]